MEYTEEQKKDVQERAEAFRTEFTELTKKHEVDFVALPRLVPNEKGVFGVVCDIQIGDTKYIPKQSNIA